jgi:hypothetical protein
LLAHAPLLIVISLCIFAYSASVHGPFVLDNDELIRQDSRVHTLSAENIFRVFDHPYYATASGLYRPVTTLTYLLNCAVLAGDLEPEGYHRLNMLLHAANICLVYVLGLLLLKNRTAALLMSALWGLHPILTEGVSNIAGRADMLATFGVLSMVLCYHAAALAEDSIPQGSRTSVRHATLAAAVACSSFIAVWSKESGIVVIAAVAAYDMLFLRGQTLRSARVIVLGAAVLPIAAYLAARGIVLSHFPVQMTPFVDNPLTGANFLMARLTAFKIIGRYMGLLLWPARLSADYSYAQIPVDGGFGGVFGLLLCLAVAAVAIWAGRHLKPLCFGIVLFFLGLAPTANVLFPIGSIMAERFLYLPAVGFVLAAVAGAQAIARTSPARRVLLIAACGLCLALLSRTYVRNRDWSDARLFAKSLVDAAPESYKGHITYAAQLPLRTGRDRALVAAEIDRALRILSPLPDGRTSGIAYRIAGVLYRRMGEELAAHPEGGDVNPGVWYDKSLAALLRYEAIAVEDDRIYRARNVRAGLAPAVPANVYAELARTLVRKNERLEAVSFFEKGRSLEADPDLLEDEGATLDSLGEYRKAAQALVEAMVADGSRSYLMPKIAEMYRAAEPDSCAVDRDMHLNPQCPMVHADICSGAQHVESSFARHGQAEDAAAFRQMAGSTLNCTETSGR